MFSSSEEQMYKNSSIPLIKKADLNDPTLRANLVKDMGYNYYGELVWPNDIFYCSARDYCM